jgi:XapX domain-containing protein
MKPYLLSLGAGILVGLVYSMLGVRSPAPPVVALVGLFGILLGEQAVPVVKTVLAGGAALAYVRKEAAEHVLGPHVRKSNPEKDS